MMAAHVMLGHVFDDPRDPVQDALRELRNRREAPEFISARRARSALKQYSSSVPDDLIHEVLPFAAELFQDSGTHTDYRLLKKLCKRAGDTSPLTEVRDSLRTALPDVWVKEALANGRIDAAIECWFENEDHKRMRHCADKLIEVVGLEDPDLLASCRMSTIEYLIGRATRRHYIRSCAALRQLRDELERGGHGDYWPHILDDVRDRFSSRPALLNELDKAGFAEQD